MKPIYFSISEIAQHIGATIFNPNATDLSTPIAQMAPLQAAQAGHVTFLTNAHFRPFAAKSQASAIITRDQLPEAGMVQLLHPHPQVAMARTAQLFHKPLHSFKGQSPQAYIDASAEVAPSATLFPFVYVGPGAKIAPDCVLYPHAYIGENCSIGARSVIYPGVVLMNETKVGADVIIHGGAVLGADGFGFAPTSERLEKIPQIGHVVIEDEVEIGPLVTIDRATFDRTIIRRGAKLDSQVHIGHNCDIGEMSMLCGQVGVAGSVKIGKRCIAAGQSGISQGLTLGDRVVLGAKTAMLRSESEPGEYLGIPAVPGAAWRRQAIALTKLPELLKQVKRLEEKVAELQRREQP